VPESIQRNKSSEKKRVNSRIRSRHPRANESLHRRAHTLHYTHCSSAISRRRSSPSTRCTLIRQERLETVPQSLHVGVPVTQQLEARGDDLGDPSAAGSVVIGFPHQEEVAGVGGVDGEVVGAVPGVGFGVGGEPCLCEYVLVGVHNRIQDFGDLATYLTPPWTSSGTSHHHTSRRPSSPWP
jgi:hypothetical protein